MRIVGGKWKGTELISPGKRVRPTAEAVRDAWMAAVQSRLEDARVIDFFAGTGALGLEAISRGASTCDFIEHGAPALHALKANVAKLRLRKSTRIFKRDALAFARSLEAGSYDLAFADPPYASGQLDHLIEIWLDVPFAALLTVEHASDHSLPGRPRRHSFGDTTISIYGAPS